MWSIPFICRLYIAKTVVILINIILYTIPVNMEYDKRQYAFFIKGVTYNKRCSPNYMGGLFMVIVNPYFLHDLLSPIAGLGDDDEAVSFNKSQNVKSEEQYRNIIRKELVGYFNGLSDIKKEKSKSSLKYYLTKNDVDWGRVFDSCLPPFDPPQIARDFFIWLWEELFGGENYLISDLKQFKVVADIHEPNRP